MQSDIFDINRRDMLGRAMFLLGAATLPPDGLLAATAEGSTLFLSAPRFALLGAAADTIVPRTDTPGATDVGVPALFDGMLRDWASPDHRNVLIEALDRIDALARTQHGRPFVALDPQNRTTLLAAHDIAALKPAAATAAPPAAASPPVVVDPNHGRPRQEPVQTPVQGQAPAKAEKTGESAASILGPVVVDPGYRAMIEAAGGYVVAKMDELGPPGLGIHEMGTACMGKDPKKSVLNRYNQAHDVPNLFITDGSAMASSGCQNPSLTYMALSARAAHHAAQFLKEGKI